MFYSTVLLLRIRSYKKILSLSLSQYDNLNINIEDEIVSFEKIII